MTTIRSDDLSNQITQISGSSKKEEEKKKQQMLTGVLGLQPNMASHTVLGVFLPKYAKQNGGNVDKTAFRLDLIRMLALHRLNTKTGSD